MEKKMAAIREYSFKPRWNKSFQKGAKGNHLLLGIELEVVFPEERGLDDFRACPEVLALTGPAHQGEGPGARILLKHDGSLPASRSVEVVFHPAHLEKLRATVAAVVSAALRCDASGWHETAGSHIHIARGSLSTSAQGGFLLFWNLLEENQLLKLAGRADGNYSHRQPEALESPFVALLDSPGHRYRVDTTRKETLEVRVFRGDVSADSILSRASLVDGVAAYCRAHPLTREVATGGKWREVYSVKAVSQWLSAQGKYPLAAAMAAA